MKKLIVLLAAAVLLAAVPACQDSGNSGPVGDTAETSVVLCIESQYRQYFKELIDYLSATGNETTYELLVLPTAAEKRETELTRLRAEIMAGGGPDAFILDTTLPGTVGDSSEEDPPEKLFPNVEASMYSQIFLNVEDMVQSSEVIELESCNQTVMDVGVTDQGRFLLPLTYTFYTNIVESSSLRDPAFTFSSIDELLASDETALQQVFASHTLLMPPAILGKLADYEAQTLLVTPETLLAAVESANSRAAVRDSSAAASGSSGYINGSLLERIRYTDTAYSFFPVPDQRGGVTAGVSLYAAINRNTQHPQEAFDFIELLYSDEVITATGWEVNGRYYGSTYSLAYTGIPVKEAVYFDDLAGGEAGTDVNAATMTSLRAMVQRIDSAVVYSTLEQDVFRTYFSYGTGDPEKSLAQRAQETISSMEMSLAE